jgi:hypothetical protein
LTARDRAIVTSSSTELDLAVEALNRGDARASRPAFERLTRIDPGRLDAWLGLALACRALGDDPVEIQAIDRVLALDPRHIPALSMKAERFERLGDDRAAKAFYAAVVAAAPAPGSMPPTIQEMVRAAGRRSAHYSRVYETHLREAVVRAGFSTETSSRRFAQSVDLLLGRGQIYLQSPKSFYFPEMPQRQFYERHEFPWLAAIEAQTDLVREEMLRAIRDPAAVAPYVRTDPNRPAKAFGNLRDNPDWSAVYLIRNGAVVPEAAALCPATMAALRAAPLTDAPGATPSVLFSLLRPGVRIPPHTGHNNARLICHLPLVVPPGCGLRVGSETREWKLGEALIFDDSIEHEAWNEGDALRVVLLFDIWRPELTLEERALVAATLGAVVSYGGAPPD